MKSEEIDAVFGEDMEEFLESLGILNEIAEGTKTCFFCDEKVEIKDIQSVFPADDAIQICCSSYHCYKEFMDRVKNH